MRVPNNSIGLSSPWCRLQLLWFLHWICPLHCRNLSVSCSHIQHLLWVRSRQNLLQLLSFPIFMAGMTSALVCVSILSLDPISDTLWRSFISPNLMWLVLKMLNCPHLVPFPVFTHLYLCASYHIIQIFHCSFHCFWQNSSSCAFAIYTEKK